MTALYFDYNATTPVLPRIRESMLPFLGPVFGNPGSDHVFGLHAKEGVHKGRFSISSLLGCRPEEVIFTGCATESNNLALLGTLVSGDHVITSSVEHPAVLEPLKHFAKNNGKITILPVDQNGLVSPEDAARSVTPETKLVSVMLANNETGAIQPVARLAALIREKKSDVLVHTDAAQAVGKIPVRVDRLGIDLLSMAGHKLYAPKGIGALYVREGVRLAPLTHGGGQERGLRPGTENVASIAGLGEACAMADEDLDREGERQEHLGSLLLRGIEDLGVPFRIHGRGAPRLPNTMSIGFKNMRAADIISGLVGQDVAVSAGAACHGLHVGTMSHVLQAMSVDPCFGLGTIRISWGRLTSLRDVQQCLERLAS
ncbi:MAG: cysteine desulfurase family protein, partial [Desulfovibrionales bacterium]